MNPRKNDVLASNLLFAALLLTIGEYIFRLGVETFASGSFLLSSWALSTVTWWAIAWSLLFVVLRAGLYYAVRQGAIWAKLLVAFFFITAAYFTTNWRYHIVAGVNLHDIIGYSGVSLVQHLLVLSALVLMFTKPRVAAL